MIAADRFETARFSGTGMQGPEIVERCWRWCSQAVQQRPSSHVQSLSSNTRLCHPRSNFSRRMPSTCDCPQMVAPWPPPLKTRGRPNAQRDTCSAGSVRIRHHYQHASRVTGAKGAIVKLGNPTCARGGGSAGRVCQTRAIQSSNGAVSGKAGSTGNTSVHQTANCTCLANAFSQNGQSCKSRVLRRLLPTNRALLQTPDCDNEPLPGDHSVRFSTLGVWVRGAKVGPWAARSPE